MMLGEKICRDGRARDLLAAAAVVSAVAMFEVRTSPTDGEWWLCLMLRLLLLDLDVLAEPRETLENTLSASGATGLDLPHVVLCDSIEV